MTRNITLSLDEDVLQEASVLAAKKGLYVSALLRSELMRMVVQERKFVKARESVVLRLKRGSSFGGGLLPDRNRLHDRA